jgi:Na+/H+ antiporter NhaD/arsenite permease-like protein
MPPGVLLNLLPFAVFLGLIAVLPLLPRVSGWWERHSSKLVLAIPAALSGVALHVLRSGDWVTVGHTGLDYLAFIALLTSLFVVTGGIHISGSYAGFPRTNTLLLGIGAVSANLLGTTGASMLLVRPLLSANRARRHKTHIVVFFIMVVANCGGLLTPLGDPPLYLGFLRGVPFDWTLRLWPEWALTNGALLGLFFWLDSRRFADESGETHGALSTQIARSERALHIRGKRNLFWLGGVLATIMSSGYLLRPRFALAFGAGTADLGCKAIELLVLTGISICSYYTTRPHIRRANEFSFGPMREVAVLFFGVFGAMLPVLALLDEAGGRLGVTEPWQYFWTSGCLSAFLDSAPAYLMFASLAAGQNGVPPSDLAELAARSPALLAAISSGTVFMGAMTYVGNGPNFMLKAVAEHAGIQMPSFGRYMVWSVAILIPLFLLETWLFFWPGT